MRATQHKLSVARGEHPAELLFKNARVVNVFSGEIHETNVAVDDERVIGFGDYEAREIVDSKRVVVVVEEQPLLQLEVVAARRIPADCH